MTLNKYIILSPTVKLGTNQYGQREEIYTAKITLVNGFTGDEISKALDIQQEWTPLGNGADRLYFLPGCTVPRFKVREFYNCTIKPENATACFVSRQSLTGSDTTLVHYSNLYKCTDHEAQNIMLNLKDLKSKNLYFNIMDNNTIKAVFLNKEFWLERAYSTYFFMNNTRLSEYTENSRYSHKSIMKEPEFQLYSFPQQSELHKVKCQYYFEDAVLKYLNQNNLLLNEEKYQELRAFGNTSDDENLILMMELMSNCDFEKSIVYLLFLLKEFGRQIVPLKESNHVNFKSLLSYLGLKPEDLSNMDINIMTGILRKHKQFTRNNALRLSMLFAENGNIDYDNPGNICWTEGPVLKLDCESLLNDNA